MRAFRTANPNYLNASSRTEPARSLDRRSGTEAQASCADCSSRASSEPANSWVSGLIASITGETREKPAPSRAGEVSPRSQAQRVDPACVLAGLTREVGREGFLCEPESSQALAFSVQGGCPSLQPTLPLARYVAFAMDRAFDCADAIAKSYNPSRPSVPRQLLLKKFNTESGFRFYLSGDAGVGIGQLTNPAFQDLEPAHSNMFQRFRGAPRQPAGGKNRGQVQLPQQCDMFRSAILGERTAGREPENSNNRCTWLSPGRGLAHNLIYSVVYYLRIRDQLLPEKFGSSVYQCLQRHPSLLAEISFWAYSSVGSGQAAKGVIGLLNNQRLIDSRGKVNCDGVGQALPHLRESLARMQYLSSANSRWSELANNYAKLNPNGEPPNRLVSRPNFCLLP